MGKARPPAAPHFPEIQTTLVPSRVFLPFATLSSCRNPLRIWLAHPPLLAFLPPPATMRPGPVSAHVHAHAHVPAPHTGPPSRAPTIAVSAGRISRATTITRTPAARATVASRAGTATMQRRAAIRTAAAPGPTSEKRTMQRGRGAARAAASAGLLRMRRRWRASLAAASAAARAVAATAAVTRGVAARANQPWHRRRGRRRLSRRGLRSR